MNEHGRQRLVRRTAHILSLGLLIALLGACAAHFAPEYNPETAAQITATYKAVNQFYAKLADVPVANRAYKNLAANYENVAVEIKALVWRASLQANNKISADMAKQVLADWNTIEARNKKRNRYSDTMASIEQHRLDALLTNLATVESFKQKPGK